MIAGPVILAIIIVVVLPVMFLLTGSIVAVLFSWALPETVDTSHEGSELIDLNR